MAIEYEDVEVEISCVPGSPPDQPKFEVRLLSSPFDRPREFFELPYPPAELQAQLKDWDDLIFEVDDEKAKSRALLAKELGRRIYASVFHGKVGRTFDSCLADLSAKIHGEAGLRIRVSFGERESYRPEVVGLPWELLYQSDLDRFLGKGSRTQVVRFLDTPQRILPLQIEPPLKVLVVLCSPESSPDFGLAKIDLDQHQRLLQEAIVGVSNIGVRFLKNATLAKLTEALTSQSYHVVHFLGHGYFRKDSGEGTLFFENPDRRWHHQVTGKEFAIQLEGIPSLRLGLY